MKKSLWRMDWLAGVIITLVFFVFQGSDLLQGLERTAYDVGVRASTRVPDSRIAVIAIDDDSIANIGRWPWSREVHARLIDLLKQAKVIAHTVFFLEPQIDPGIQHLQSLLKSLNRSSLSKNLNNDIKRLRLLAAELNQHKPLADVTLRAAIEQLSNFMETSALVNKTPDDLKSLRRNINSEINLTSNDIKLSESIKNNGGVVLSMPFQLGDRVGKPDKPLPSHVADHALTNIRGDDVSLIESIGGTPPIPEIGRVALATGHLNATLDVDGGVRSEPLVINYYGTYIPSVSLLLVARTLNLSINDIGVNLGHGVRLGKRFIATDRSMRMQTFFYDEENGRAPFKVDSFYDVISGRVPASKFAGKIVLIGATAVGVGTPHVTPVDAAMAPVLTLAHSVSSLLKQHYFVVPEWATLTEYLVFLLIALYLTLLLPRINATAAAVTTTLLVAGLLAAHYVLMTVEAYWLRLMVPITLLLAGHLLLTTKRYLVTEKGKIQADVETAESNRMLGLSHQENGQLDMAFDMYRKCPLDDSLMELVYNLGLDFERKRQFNKAVAAYQYMADYNPKFRDIEQRSGRARAAEETIMVGSGGKGNQKPLVLDEAGGLPKPMLGRYRVEKEIGKGAMGVVYQGLDPQIDRVVAIKTLDLLQETDQEEKEEVKARFFREARAAGRLRHPNIVTIYDAGEEQDLAYIAMEFLTGSDLTIYTKPGNLLPLSTALRIVISAADALEYAHTQNVIHRDIKPANVMFELKTGSMKITDFGIARISDASKTKTGTVMGTPSYMSPEQIAGRKVDGRTDLFSLGVMLYQLVSGNLPFQADTLTNLMYKIANEQPPDILELRPELASHGDCLSTIINKVLQKQAEDRYRSGSEFSKELRTCAKKLVGKPV